MENMKGRRNDIVGTSTGVQVYLDIYRTVLISSTKFNLIASSLATLQQPHLQFWKALRQYFSLFFTKKYPVYVKNNRSFQKVHRHFRKKLNVRLINSATERILMHRWALCPPGGWSFWELIHELWNLLQYMAQRLCKTSQLQFELNGAVMTP